MNQFMGQGAVLSLLLLAVIKRKKKFVWGRICFVERKNEEKLLSMKEKNSKVIFLYVLQCG